MNPPQVRVRFAPSPTGPLHLGGVRTALYNYLFARKNNGKFILRIEDTDRSRFVTGAEEYIMASLKWCGLECDEDIEKGGPYMPYRQSERTALYQTFINQLLESGHAYYAFDTPEELDALRIQYQHRSSDLFQYNAKNRSSLRNSLFMTKSEVHKSLSEGKPYVVRIRIPENEEIVFHDLIRGEVCVHSENLDDKVLYKSDGLPTYHMANVVDDFMMKITHVIRGEEWLPSAPLHLLLYRFLGWEKIMPQFAHLPLILKPEGTGKLSKRDGDRLGFPVFPLEWIDPLTKEVFHGYREDGYLPEAFINMLALLGWNPGSDRELFSMNEMIELFSIERVGKSGSKFDPEKAKWFNHQYLSRKQNDELAELLERILSDHSLKSDRAYLIKVIDLIKDRIVLIPDLWKNSWFFFQPPERYDELVKQKIWLGDTSLLICDFLNDASQIQNFNKESFHLFIQDFTNKKKIKLGLLMNPLRLLTVGSNQGPGMIEIVDILGKEEFLKRIKTGIEALSVH